MKRAALILLTLGLALPAASQDRAVLVGESRFWIEGTTTATGFTCEVDSVVGEARFQAGQSALGADSGREAAGNLAVQVETFDCGHRRMTQDLRQTLKGESHPAITFSLASARATDSSIAADRSDVLVTGSLTIAGVERGVAIEATIVRDRHDHFRVFGSQRLLLTDFGIEPPTKLLGLIKVRNEIDVFFDLVAETRSGDSDSR